MSDNAAENQPERKEMVSVGAEQPHADDAERLGGQFDDARFGDQFDDGSDFARAFRPDADAVPPEETPLQRMDLPPEHLPQVFADLISNVLSPVIAAGDLDATNAPGGGFGLPSLGRSRSRKAAAAEVARAVIESANVFREQAAKYQLNCEMLNAELGRNAAWKKWQSDVEIFASQKGHTVQHVRDLINDPTQTSGPIKDLRDDLSAILRDPAVGPLFDDVERSFRASTESMTRVQAGINELHKTKGVNLGGLASVDSVVADMAGQTPNAPFSRPGGVRMDGDDNALRKRLAEMADRIGEIVRAVVRLAGATVGLGKAAAGPSPT